MKEKAIYITVGIVIGIVFAPQISKIPLVSKLPQI